MKNYSRNALSLILFGLIVFISGCATVPKKQPGIVRTDLLKDVCLANDIQLQWDGVNQVITLARQSQTARLLVDSPVVMMNGKQVLLSDSLRVTKSAIIVPPDFQEKVIQILMTKVSHLLRRFNKIVIDPGHGGKDPGATGQSGLTEKSVVLDVAQRLKKELEQKGFEIIMTRTTDEFIPLNKRTEIAAQAKGDLFLSIHANASRQRNAHGFEVYYLREADKTKQRDEPQFKLNCRYLMDQMKMQRNTPVLDSIISDMMLTYRDNESKVLARSLVDSAPAFAHVSQRGSKAAGFYVLKNNYLPSILVEIGFLTNPQEEKLLKDEFNRQKIAEGLSETITEYANK